MKFKPTETELEILQILWQKGPSTVRQVHDILSTNRDTAYTTTLKLMQIMNEKGLLSRDKSARQHVYHPAVSEKDTIGGLLGAFLNSAYRGSTSALVLQALGNHNTTPEELEEIKKLIENIQKDKDHGNK